MAFSGSSSELASPPLNEVVLSLQLDPIRGLKAPFLGLFWEAIRPEYPLVEEHPALDPVKETFDERGPALRTADFRFVTKMETPRCWFITASGDELVQLQQDRMIYNWRRRSEAAVYPRYEALRTRFLQQAARLRKFVAKEELGEITPNQCEITYINSIDIDQWPQRGELNRAFRFWSPMSMSELENPEDAGFNMRCRIGGLGVPARLHVTLGLGKRAPDKKLVHVLNLTARGAPTSPDVEGVLAFMDYARNEVNRAFLALTSEQIQRDVWGRRG